MELWPRDVKGVRRSGRSQIEVRTDVEWGHYIIPGPVLCQVYLSKSLLLTLWLNLGCERSISAVLVNSPVLPFVCMLGQQLQSCLTLCDTVDCSLAGFPIHEILQATVLEWIVLPSSRGSSQLRDQTHIFSPASPALVADSLPLSNWGSLFLLFSQFSSVTQSCLTLCNPMDCSTPGLPVRHQLPEFIQTHVHRVRDAI